MTLLGIVLDTLHDKTTLEYAHAINLYGLLCIDTNRATEAVEPLQQGLKIREKLLGPEHPRVAVSFSNLGMCYTEIGPPMLDEAMKSLEKSLTIRLKSDPDMVGNTYSNMSSLYLRMRQPNQAEATLAKCPSLKDMNDNIFLRTDNPRFSRLQSPPHCIVYWPPRLTRVAVICFYYPESELPRGGYKTL